MNQGCVTHKIVALILISWNQSSLLANFAGYVNRIKSCTHLRIQMSVGACFLYLVEDCGYCVCIDDGLMYFVSCSSNLNGIVCFLFSIQEASEVLIFRET